MGTDDPRTYDFSLCWDLGKPATLEDLQNAARRLPEVTPLNFEDYRDRVFFLTPREVAALKT